MFHFFYLFLSNNIILRNKNIINEGRSLMNKHYIFNFKKNINNSSISDYHNFIQIAKINFIANESMAPIDYKNSSDESINSPNDTMIPFGENNQINETNLIEEKKNNTILRWKYSNKSAYDGYDMRYLINNSEIDNELDYELDYKNMYKIYELFNKKKLYDILLSNISIYTKLDYIGKEEKNMSNQNITNGGLYKDWNFEF
jgi:hypothetical protein